METTRSLKHGDEVPEGTPRRYMTTDGYVRLRWKVGVAQYVEVLEHRLVLGIPDGEVHHIDGDKTNNALENLVVLTKEAHARLHAEVHRNDAKCVTEWDGMPSRSAYEKRQRRLAREQARREEDARIAAMRRQGMTTVELGRILGVDPSNITRACQRAEAV